MARVDRDCRPIGVAQAGLGLVPEGRQIFPTLSVAENLVATAAARFGPPRWTVERIYGFFPRLAERRRHMGTHSLAVSSRCSRSAAR